MEQNQPQLNQLPLREPTFFILLSLVGDTQSNQHGKHGYAILQDVEALSSGAVRLSTSTLYEALARLLDQGLIERIDEDPGAEEAGKAHPGKPRKVYRLTRQGRQVLEGEVRRLENLTAAAVRRLGEQI